MLSILDWGKISLNISGLCLAEEKIDSSCGRTVSAACQRVFAYHLGHFQWCPEKYSMPINRLIYKKTLDNS